MAYGFGSGVYFANTGRAKDLFGYVLKVMFGDCLMLRYAALCDVTLCCVMLWYIMLRYVMLRYDMRCYDM